ncbi:MAG: hypothetical protein JO134_18430 [Xanthobacteraceae bacterium]|nr:hypothetical protein [Xanthobacteraceae bacterium]
MPRGDKLRRIILAFVTSVLAIGSGVALTHVGRVPDKTAVSNDEDAPTIGEGRNLTREILRSRREQPEALAEVHPDPSLGARQPIVTKEVAAKEPAAKETKEHVAIKDAARARPTTATAAVVLPRSRPEADSSAAPPPANGAVVADAAPPEQPQSFGSKVFSTVSNFTGKAANFTGDTANFVIDLPGKLFSAGGKLFDRQPPAKRDAL